MKLKDLFISYINESGNTKAKNIWVEHFPDKLRLNFIIDNKQKSNDLFAVDVKHLDLSVFSLSKHLKRFENLKVINVVFGNVLEDNSLNYKQIQQKTPASGLKIIMGAKNIIIDYIKSNDIDIIIFSSKNNDGAFHKRAQVYSSIADISAKQYNFWVKKYEDKDGVYFILGKNSIQLTKLEQEALENELIPKLSFKDKIKK